MTLQRYRICITEAEPGYFLCDHEDGDVVLTSDAEQALLAQKAALKEKDKEIAARDVEINALKKRVRELEHAVPCDSCVHIYDTPNAAGSIAACKKCHDGSGWEPQQ